MTSMDFLKISLFLLIKLAASQNELGICDFKKESIINRKPSIPYRPDTKNNMPTPELIRVMGYPAETHYVTTEDGYNLALHRIPHGLNNDGPGPRPVVFVQHGLLCSSADWVMSIPSKGLGFILADAGYDVWLGNYRGNTYSRNHTFLDPESGKDGFWDFTWDEMAHYDLPAMIEKVLELTEQPDLLYVGHSMGTTAFMAMHHYRPDVGEKVRLANFLAPVASETHMGGPLGWIANLGWLIGDIMSLLGVGEFLPDSWIIDCLASLFCHDGLGAGLCSNILFILCGFDEAQMNTTLLPTILHHTPAGASTYTVLHYAQEKTEKGFHAYDWGSKSENFDHHGGNPPVYDLKAVTTPVAVYWSDNDYFAMPEDILHTIANLPNIVRGMNHHVEWPEWSHLDYLWGIDADKFVFDYVVENLAKCRDQDCRTFTK